MKTIAIPILALLLVAALYLYAVYCQTCDLGDRVVSVIIRPGDSLSDVSEELLSEGVVKSRIMLNYPARLFGIDKKLTPGRYDFSGKNSCRSVLAKLEAADFVNIKVTIPEGATIWEAASVLRQRLELDSTAVVRLDSDSTFLRSHNLPGLEGFLFPETYFFPWGIDETLAIGEMIQMFRLRTDGVWPDTIVSGFSRYDIIKLASIIEAETGLVDERRLVSSVYHNRLRKNMKLDADPTVIYGLGGLDRPLTHRDLRQDSPYNTYLRKGLPATPINSPGLASIRAALHPEETDYLYFVADETGGHYFSKTNFEHNQAKRRIKSSKRKRSSGAG